MSDDSVYNYLTSFIYNLNTQTIFEELSALDSGH